MIIYLKSGQTIDMGEVTHIEDGNGFVYVPIKNCDNNTTLFCFGNLDTINYPDENVEMEIINKDNKMLSVRKHDIIAILEDIK